MVEIYVIKALKENSMFRKMNIVIVLWVLAFSTAFGEKLAVVTKFKGEVLLKKAGEVEYSPSVQQGTILEQGDYLKTGDGYAVLFLFDDKSQVKLRPKTELGLQLLTDSTGSTMRVKLEYGKVLSAYNKNASFGFQVSTPTSVASVKGTRFWTSSSPNGVDRVVVLEGTVNVLNNFTGRVTTANAGETAISTSTGGLLTTPTTEDEIPADPEEEFGAAPTPETEQAAVDTTQTETAMETQEPPPVPTGGVEAPPEGEAEGEGGGGLLGENVGLNAGFGAVTIDGKLYNQIALRPDIHLGKFGIGLDLVLYIDQDGNIRTEEWKKPKNLIDKILYIRWGQPGDPIFFEVGGLKSVVMGYGLFVNGYSNMTEYPSVRKVGAHFGLKLGPIGAEAMLANFKEFTKTPNFGFGLAALRGTYSLGKLQFGATFVTDYNQYLGMKDTDGDGYPDLVDDFPEDKTAYLDSDGDGRPDDSPDEWDVDGDGLPDHLPDSLSQYNIDQDITTKPEPLNIHRNVRHLFGLSADVSYPIFQSSLFSALAFAEAGKYMGSSHQIVYRDDAGNLASRDAQYGWGIAAPGLRMTVMKFIHLNVEYRMTGGNFVYGLFDYNYDNERISFMDSDTGLVPLTRFDKLSNNPAMKGVFGSLRADIMGILSLSGGYQDMRASGSNPVRGLNLNLALASKVIPKVKEAMAYLNRMNVENPFKIKSEGTILGYRVTVELGGGATLTWDFRQYYRDLDGSGAIDQPNEIIRSTNIETGLSF